MSDPTDYEGEESLQGQQGRPGQPGATGRTGEAGVTGPAGLAGAPGTAGATGTPGERGLPGRSGLAGLTGREGEQGQQGIQGESGRTPRTVWMSRLGYLIFVVGLLGAMTFAIQQSQDARAKAIAESEQRDEDLKNEQERADDAICRIAATNRAQSLALLTAAREGTLANPDPDAAQQARNIAVITRLIASAEEPFPEPCRAYSIPPPD